MWKWALLAFVVAFLGWQVLKSRNIAASRIPPPPPNINPQDPRPIPPNQPQQQAPNYIPLITEVLKQGGNVFNQVWNKTPRDEPGANDYDGPAEAEDYDYGSDWAEEAFY